MEMEESRVPPVFECVFCGDFWNTSKDLEGEEESEVKCGEKVSPEEIEKFVEEMVFKREGKEGKILREEDLEVLKTLPVCDGCGEVMRGAVEKKRRVEETEGKVKELRKILMEETRKLEGILKEYYGEMKRMEGILKTSEGKRREMAEKKAGTDYFSVVKNLKELLLEVVQNLEEKKGDKKGCRDKLRESEGSKKRSRKRYLGLGAEEETEWQKEDGGIMCLPECPVKMEEDEEVVEEVDMEQLIKEEPEEEGDPLEPDDLWMTEENEITEEGTPSDSLEQGQVRRRRPKRNKRTTVRNGDDDEIWDNDEEEVPNNSGDTSNDDFVLDEKDIDSERESGSSSEEATDDETVPKSKSSRNATCERILSSIDFSQMSKPKRNLIKRVLRKKYPRPGSKPSNPDKPEIEDPRRTHLMDYNPSSDTFTLDGILIHLIEEPNIPLDLECGLCSWRVRHAHNSTHSIDSLMYNHIASQHLHLFQCLQCPSNLGDFNQYSQHVLGHRLRFPCDICGRPLLSALALSRHKWYHLNAQEAALLVSQGQKDPRKTQAPSQSHLCDTCGKTFLSKSLLHSHEKVHAPNRPKVTCDTCGKQFLESGFPYHKRYYCFPPGVTQPRLSCPQCPKVFTTKQALQDHMERHHATERPYKCGICKKGFKTQKDVRFHEKRHVSSNVAQQEFVCRKGCGRSYTKMDSWKGHEKKCDGRGAAMTQRWLDAGEERPWKCRKGCGRAFKTSATERGHQKICKGVPFVVQVPGGPRGPRERRSWECRKGCGLEFQTRKTERDHRLKGICKGAPGGEGDEKGS